VSARFKNPAVVAQGMAYPSGLAQTAVDPVVQSTTRPAGTLLKSSPGYDSIRVGKNRFQGKGPTGGFRMQEFAEDLGGTGAALAVIPGDTTPNDVTEWLPEDQDSLEEGDMIIADRSHGGAVGDIARGLHEALGVIPDMGDRHIDRPLSKNRFLVNPVGLFRKDFQENPAITVGATAGLIMLITYLARDAEREYKSRRGGGGITNSTVAAGETPVATAGDSAEAAAKTISNAADKAVESIGDAAKEAVSAIKDTAESAKETVTE